MSDSTGSSEIDGSGYTGEQARYHEAAARFLAGGVSSNVRLADKMCFERGKGSRLHGLDGRDYIDYALGMGPAILGHAHPQIVRKVAESLDRGQLFAGQHPDELTLAELIRQCVPSAELIRFAMTGSESVQAALRVARAFTNRSKYVKFEGHYHGWYDNVLVNVSGRQAATSDSVPLPVALETRGQSSGVASEALILPWNNPEAVEHCMAAHGKEVAAVIMEPVMCNSGVIPPKPGYLQAVSSLCRQFGAVFILDEVITGFRLGPGGAQQAFGVQPDLSIFAKAIGGGFPLAVLAGRAKIMQLIGSGAVNHSGTYNANLVSVVAGIATIQSLLQDNGDAYTRIERIGRRLMEGLSALPGADEAKMRVQGFPSVFNVSFGATAEITDYASFKRTSQPTLRLFLNHLLAAGVRPTYRGTWFVSAAHDERDVEETLAAAGSALTAVLHQSEALGINR